VAASRNPLSFRAARHGNRSGQTRSAAAIAAPVGMARFRPIGSAMSWPCTSTSMSGSRWLTPGARITDLAERAQVTKQTAGFLVDQLERAGYVRRVPDPRDARASATQLRRSLTRLREITDPYR
jgi:hypothetical protein